MQAFCLHDRVRTTEEVPGAWGGVFTAPAGMTGEIVSTPDWTRATVLTRYGVLLDGDPEGTPATYLEDQIEAA